MAKPNLNSEARQVILQSIRFYLNASVGPDSRETTIQASADATETRTAAVKGDLLHSSLTELFKDNLEAVNGHCEIVRGESEVVLAMTRIILALQHTRLRAKRLALSDDPEIERLVHLMDLEVDAASVRPDASAVFDFDVGISMAQAGVAETGTLVLDSEREAHRLVSLVPPVHIALIDACNIYETLGEVLKIFGNGDGEVSPTITFITGPSRTADIELTLAIGVHGPQELYVIIRE